VFPQRASFSSMIIGAVSARSSPLAWRYPIMPSLEYMPIPSGRMGEPSPVQQRVRFATKKRPYEIKGLRVAEISLIIEP